MCASTASRRIIAAANDNNLRNYNISYTSQPDRLCNNTREFFVRLQVDRSTPPPSKFPRPRAAGSPNRFAKNKHGPIGKEAVEAAGPNPLSDRCHRHIPQTVLRGTIYRFLYTSRARRRVRFDIGKITAQQLYVRARR